MKIDTVQQDDHQIKLTVEVEPETLEGAKKKAGKKISGKVKVPGFRPGKAPYSVVLRQVGEAVILEEALDILLQDIYPSIIEEAKIEPYGPGSLQNVVTMEPPTFEFMVPLAPEVELGDYRALRMEFEPKTVTGDDVEKVITNLREGQAVIEPAEGPVGEGDMVYIVLTGEREEPKEGENKQLVEERRLPVVIEKEDADTKSEWPFPGFSRKLLGMKSGEEKTIKYKFAKDYEFEDLRGVKAVYQVKVDEIKARVLPELNDDFAKSLGEYETVDDLRKDIVENLEHRYEHESNSEYEDKVIEEILKDASIKYPPQMLDEEIDSMLNELNGRLESQGLNLDIYMKSRELESKDQLKDELKPTAIDRLNRVLVLMEIAKQEEVKVDPDEVSQQIQATISQINQYYPDADARKLTSGASLQNIINRITSDKLIDNTLERLRKIAKGEPIEEEATKEEPLPEEPSDVPSKSKPEDEKAETAEEDKE